MACAVKLPSLPLDNQRTTQGPPRSRRPCPSSSDEVPQRPREPPAGWPCVACSPTQHSASLCPRHAPVYQTARGPQPSAGSACITHGRPSAAPACAGKIIQILRVDSYSALTAGWPGWSRARAQRSRALCSHCSISFPVLGFEPRGTTRGHRLALWDGVVRNAECKGTLTNYPFICAAEQTKSPADDRGSDDHYEKERRREVDRNFQKHSLSSVTFQATNRYKEEN